MERWVGKIAVVTGASAGIGAAIAIDLAKAGMKTIGLARRKSRIDSLIANLPADIRGELHSRQCDISKESEIVATFREIIETFGGIDVLINNAGIVRHGKLTDPNNTSLIQDVVNTNVMGLVFCTREAVQSMKSRAFDGHVVNINSVAGHFQPQSPPPFGPIFNIYHGSKYAVTAVTETLRQEFIHLGTKIKITSVSPGAVHTEILDAFGETFGITAEDIFVGALKPEDVSNAVLYTLGTPPHVQIHEMIIRPVGEKY